MATKNLLAAEARLGYAEALAADPDLLSYWPFDADSIDALGQANAVGGQSASFVADAVSDGKAIRLVPHDQLSVTETERLRGRLATLALFFKIVRKTEADSHPVLLAESTGQRARYIVGVKNDLSALLYRNQNASVVTKINLPTNRSLEVGRWYHLAVTSFDLDVRAYIDGYECSLFGGVYEFTRRGPKTDAAMTFGATPVEGWGSTDLCLNEVACFSRGLTQSEIHNQLIAADWEAKLKETGTLVAQVKTERDTEGARKAQALLDDPVITAPGETHVYEGDYLSAISFLVGGIGAGAIQFNGKAEPAVWQIACNYQEHHVADSFLAIRTQSQGEEPVLRALQTGPVGPFTAVASSNSRAKIRKRDIVLKNPICPCKIKPSSSIPSSRWI